MANDNVRPKDAVVPVAAVPKYPAPQGFGEVVKQYLNDSLPHYLHPSFKGVGHADSTAARPPLLASSKTEPILRTTVVEKFRDESGGQDEEEPLYVLSLKDRPIENPTKITK